MNSSKIHVCPVDGRKFATKSALKQHTDTAHRRSNQQARPQIPVKVKQVGGNEVSGVDIISGLVFKTTDSVGQLCFRVEINPMNFPATRLAAMAELYTRWRPKVLRFSIISGCSSTMGGMYMMGWTAGLSDEFAQSGLSNIQRLSTFRPNVESNLYAPKSLSVPITGKLQQNWLYCENKHQEDACHGTFVVMVSAPLQGVSGASSASLRLHLDWTVQFDSPRLVGFAEETFIYAESDQSDYFTDSVSNWFDGKVLTLKHVLGGNPVNFPGAKEGVIYRLAGGAKLKYCKKGETSTTATGDINWGVVIPGYGFAAMAVFAEEARAKAFGSDPKNAENCLKFYAAGPWVTPSNPAWKEMGGFQSPHPPSLLPTRHSIATEDNAVYQQTRGIWETTEQVARGINPSPSQSPEGLAREVHAMREEIEALRKMLKSLVRLSGTPLAGWNAYALVADSREPACDPPGRSEASEYEVLSTSGRESP